MNDVLNALERSACRVSEDSHGRHFYISYTAIQKLDFTVGTVIVHKGNYRIITNDKYIYHNTHKILGQRNIFQTFLEPSRFARVDSGPEPAFSLTPGTRKCTLPATNSLPLKIGLPNRKGSSSNHPFSGETTVSFREGNMKGCDLG